MFPQLPMMIEHLGRYFEHLRENVIGEFALGRYLNRFLELGEIRRASLSLVHVQRKVQLLKHGQEPSVCKRQGQK